MRKLRVAVVCAFQASTTHQSALGEIHHDPCSARFPVSAGL